MAKEKTFYYLVDKLNKDNGSILKSALETVQEIHKIDLYLNEGVIEVTASKDVEEQIRMTCRVAGTTLRTRIKKKDLF